MGSLEKLRAIFEEARILNCGFAATTSPGEVRETALPNRIR
jgi:hypothetical protein